MSRFLLGALAMATFVVLTSFALSRTADPAKPTGGPAWTVSQYQLDRAFRVTLNPGIPGVTAQVPASSGFILTQIKVQPVNMASVTIGINGVTETLTVVGGNIAGLNQFEYHTLNPPIIARPNDIVTISGVADVTFAGYTTLPGET